MAIAPCRECGKDVSSEAKTCPHCGVPRPTNSATAEKVSKAGTGTIKVGCAVLLIGMFLVIVLALLA